MRRVWLMTVVSGGCLWAQATRPVSPAEAQKIEQHLAAAPDDNELRARLIAFYASVPTTENEAQRIEQITWMVEHHPESLAAGYTTMMVSQNSPEYNRLRSLWLRQLQEHSQEATVAVNAATFFAFTEPDLAEQELRRGMQLALTNSLVSARLAAFYAWHIVGAQGISATGALQGVGSPVSAFGQHARDVVRQSKDTVLVGQVSRLVQELREKAALTPEQRRDWPEYGEQRHGEAPASVGIVR